MFLHRKLRLHIPTWKSEKRSAYGGGCSIQYPNPSFKHCEGKKS
uniref:Uncharacterized protein n=1 Tax=Arundo donax TaxID=35708 RepID=A0A0A9QG70_ARUDO